MLHPYAQHGETTGFPALIAADDPIGAVPDLQPVIHDYERNRARNQRRQQKKRSELPPPPPATPKKADGNHHGGEYAWPRPLCSPASSSRRRIERVRARFRITQIQYD